MLAKVNAAYRAGHVPNQVADVCIELDKAHLLDHNITVSSLASGAGMTPGGATYTGAIERLRLLPEVFDLNTAVLVLRTTRASARVMLTRWADRGFVEHAGPRAGLYLRRFESQMERGEQLQRALRMLYPSATLMGATVLHAAGWTTQIPARLQVAVEARPSYTALAGIDLHPRSVEWFRLVHGAGGFEAPNSESARGLRALKPAWALADLQGRDGVWQPDEDDLDLPEGAQDEITEASRLLGAGLEPPRPRPQA